MRVKWEKRKELVPTCPICKEKLSGNNSYSFPYRCKCGTWKSNWDNPGEFEIEEEAKSTLCPAGIHTDDINCECSG